MIDFEKAAVGHFTNPASMRMLYERGLRPEHFFDSEISSMFDWVVEYYVRHGKMSTVPPVELLSIVFPANASTGASGFDALMSEVVPVEASYICDELQGKYAKTMLQNAVSVGAIEMRTDPLAAATVLRDATADILHKTSRRKERMAYGSDDDLTYYRAEYERLSSMRDAVSVPWFLPELQDLTGGTRQGEMVVLAASPGVGKTWFACAQALNAARAGHNTLFASLELSPLDIQMRMDCIEARSVDFGAYFRGEALSTAMQDIQMAQERIKGFAGDLVVERIAREDRSPAGIFARARAMGAKYVVIDQLQFVKRPDSHANRTEAVEDVIYDLKEEVSASGDDMGLLLLHQFNREVKNKNSGIGSMQELAHSSSIEQVADLVLAIGASDEDKRNNVMNLATIKERNITRKAWQLHWGITPLGVDFSVLAEVTEGF